MLDFLVSLANLLDAEQQHEIAAELDNVLFKLAQQTQQPPIVDDVASLMSSAKRQAEGDTGQDPKQAAQQLKEGFKMLVDKISAENTQLPAQWNQVQETLLNQFANIQASSKPEEMPAMFGAIADSLDWLYSSLTGGDRGNLQHEQPKAQPHQPKQHKKSNLIVGIQSMLGLTGEQLTGVWSDGLNTLFTLYFQNYHPDTLHNNKFQGSLKQAYDLMVQDAEKGKQKPEAQPVAQEKAPEAPQLWTSKRFQITPRAITALDRIEQADGKGAGQAEINKIDNFKRVDNQDMFEEFLENSTGYQQNAQGQPVKTHTLPV